MQLGARADEGGLILRVERSCVEFENLIAGENDDAVAGEDRVGHDASEFLRGDDLATGDVDDVEIVEGGGLLSADTIGAPGEGAAAIGGDGETGGAEFELDAVPLDAGRPHDAARDVAHGSGEFDGVATVVGLGGRPGRGSRFAG